MPYTPPTFTNGVTPLNSTNMTSLGTQYTEASLSFSPDAFTAGFIVYGLACTKDGGVANQLDIAAGTAYLLQTDGTTRQRTLGSTNKTTASLNTTYYLYLQPDGTLYWSTTNSPASNSLALCTVTTDGSGNISAVTDKRTTTVAIYPNLANPLILPPLGGARLTGALAAPVVTSTTATKQTGSTLGIGTYKYVVTFACDGMESPASSVVAVTTTSGNTNVALANIPTSTDPRVTRRKIYRTTVGGSAFRWIATLGDNTTTSYTDSTADTSTSATKAAPTHPNFGGNLLAGGGYSGYNYAGNVGNVVGSVTFGSTALLSGDATTSMLPDGATGYVAPTSMIGLPQGTNAVSFGGLIRIAANPGGTVIIAQLGGTSSGTYLAIRMNSSGQVSAGNGTTWTSNSSALSTGVTHHVLLTWDGAFVSLYLDGALVGSATSLAGQLTGTAGFTLGAAVAGGSYFGGRMQEWAVYGYCLNLQQAALYNTLMSGASGNLTYPQQVLDDGALRYYRLGDGVGASVAADSARYLVQVSADGQLSTRAPVSLDGGLITTDGNGALTATAPVKLRAGYQVSGVAGVENSNASSGSNNGSPITYPVALTNTPSSITLSPATSGNANSPSTNNVSTTGFNFLCAATGNGHMFWWGTYATNGNCLWMVDPEAGTMTHHCDGCGRVREALSLREGMRVERHPTHWVMAAPCPTCGTEEHFVLTLSADDEAGWDAPGLPILDQRVQAHLIRTAQRALGIPLIDEPARQEVAS